MATPTLALIPSGYGTNKVYSVLPSDGSGDFTFGRTGTATRINKDKLIESVGSNIPRLDYTDSGCPSLLLEPQRSNLVTYSEDFSDAYWVKSGASITSNSIISPNGALNADKIIEGSANGLHQIYSDVFTTVASSNYVYSIFIKKGERIWVKIMTANNSGANFNIENGTVGIVDSGIDAEIEDYGNGWFKCSVSFNTSATADRVYVRTSESNGVISYQGDGTSGVYIYGAMLEQGSFPTSIIKTTGTSVTRLAETAFKTGVDAYINSSEGVLFAEISALANDLTTTAKPITISQSSTNLLGFYYFQSRIDAYVRVNGVNQFLKSHSLDPTINNKISLKYKTNDFALWINGFEIATDTNGTTPSGLNQLRFDDLSEKFYGKTKDLRVYNTALTDLEIEKLSSFTSFNAMALNFNYTIY